MLDKKLQKYLKGSKVFIFDYDGTIADQSVTYSFLNDFYHKFGNKDCSKELFLEAQHITAFELHRLICEELKLDMTFDEFAANYNQIVAEAKSTREQHCFSYVYDLIDNYKDVKFVLLSNGVTNHIANQLKKFGFLDKFYAVMGCATLKVSKEDIYNDTVKYFGEKQKDCVVFEDAQNYVDAAKRCGIKTVGIEHEFNKGNIAADVVIQGEIIIDSKTRVATI